MRFARYIEYPFQIRNVHRDFDIHHINENGYAHLINFPLNKNKTIVSVADLIPLLAWRGFIPNYSYPHRPRLAEHSFLKLKKAVHLIAASENTKKDLVEHCGCREEDITVIYLGCAKIFKPLPKHQKIELRNKKFKFPKNCFLILITGVAYKNHETALKVLKELRSKNKNIYIVRLGPQHNEDDKVWTQLKNKYLLNEYVIEISNLTLREVSQLYNSVDCLLFPSWYEGFGRPPLEAMASGLPVIASNAASIPEVVGNAGFLYNPSDVQGMKQGINIIMNQENIRKKMVSRGLKQSSKFTWEKYVQEIVEVYKSVVNKNIKNW